MSKDQAQQRIADEVRALIDTALRAEAEVSRAKQAQKEADHLLFRCGCQAVTAWKEVWARLEELSDFCPILQQSADPGNRLGPLKLKLIHRP